MPWEVFYVGPSALIVGGLGEAVLSAVGEEPGIVVHRLAVSHVPRSGKPQELLDIFGISAKSIVAAVKRTFANWNSLNHPELLSSSFSTPNPDPKDKLTTHPYHSGSSRIYLTSSVWKYSNLCTIVYPVSPIAWSVFTLHHHQFWLLENFKCCINSSL